MERGRNNVSKHLTKLTKLTILLLCYFSISLLLFSTIKHEDNKREKSSELTGLSAGAVGKAESLEKVRMIKDIFNGTVVSVTNTKP